MSSSQANIQPVVGSHVENTVNNTNTLSVSKNPSDEKPDKFNGTDFKRWQQKMLFYLTTMNLANITRELIKHYGISLVNYLNSIVKMMRELIKEY